MNKTGRPPKYILTDEARQAMIERYDSSTKVISELSAQFGVPRDTIKDWARRLQISRYKWSELEVAYLKKYIHKKTLAEIAKHLRKTRQSVQYKASRLDLVRVDGYMLCELCEGLGTYESKVHLWMARGWIVGTRTRPDGRMYNFSDAAIKKFLQEHPDEISEEVMSSLWVQDILSDYGLGELVSVR